MIGCQLRGIIWFLLVGARMGPLVFNKIFASPLRRRRVVVNIIAIIACCFLYSNCCNIKQGVPQLPTTDHPTPPVPSVLWCMYIWSQFRLHNMRHLGVINVDRKARSGPAWTPPVALWEYQKFTPLLNCLIAFGSHSFVPCLKLVKSGVALLIYKVSCLNNLLYNAINHRK